MKIRLLPGWCKLIWGFPVMHALRTMQLNSKIAKCFSLSNTSSNPPLLPRNLRFRSCTERTRTFSETASISFTFCLRASSGSIFSFRAISRFCQVQVLWRAWFVPIVWIIWDLIQRSVFPFWNRFVSVVFLEATNESPPKSSPSVEGNVFGQHPLWWKQTCCFSRQSSLAIVGAPLLYLSLRISSMERSERWWPVARLGLWSAAI